MVPPCYDAKSLDPVKAVLEGPHVSVLPLAAFFAAGLAIEVKDGYLTVFIWI